MDSQSKPDAESPSAVERLLGVLANALASVRNALGNFLELVTLEIRRAGLTLMWMLWLSAIATILFVAAWFRLMAALTLWLVALGMTWAVDIALVALLHLLT